jgi:small subunit ribosomal protein S1
VTNPEDDFAAMFEASEKSRRLERGQTIEGAIVAIGDSVAFVDVGGKSEAQIDLAELRDADGALEVSVGDRVQAMVISTAGGVVLSRKGVRNAATQRELEDAFRTGVAVEGRVQEVIKGGYEVRIARERAFCPLSQIDIVRTTDPAVHVGQVYAFRVVEYKEGGRNVVVSRRKVLEDEQRAAADEVRASIVAGAVLRGRVASVLDFGAFIDLGGGIQGLLHASEMGWSRVASPGEIVATGDEITVTVLRVDEATGRIALSLKPHQADPWATMAERYPVGQVRTGRVTRVAEFGAFVELEPGVTALMPLAETGLDRDADLRRALPVGSDVEVVVLDVDAAGRRMRVSRSAVKQQQEQAEVREYTERTGQAEPSLGSLADKLRGALGRR